MNQLAWIFRPINASPSDPLARPRQSSVMEPTNSNVRGHRSHVSLPSFSELCSSIQPYFFNYSLLRGSATAPASVSMPQNCTFPPHNGYPPQPLQASSSPRVRSANHSPPYNMSPVPQPAYPVHAPLNMLSSYNLPENVPAKAKASRTKSATKAESVVKVPKKRGRKKKANTICTQCRLENTPEWRRGPEGSRTLCNACGLFYLKLTKKFGPEKANAVMRSKKAKNEIYDRLVPSDEQRDDLISWYNESVAKTEKEQSVASV